jgi:hypothetical protein
MLISMDMVLNYFAIFGIMVYSLVLTDITTLIVLEIAEDEIIETLRINTM